MIRKKLRNRYTLLISLILFAIMMSILSLNYFDVYALIDESYVQKIEFLNNRSDVILDEIEYGTTPDEIKTDAILSEQFPSANNNEIKPQNKKELKRINKEFEIRETNYIPVTVKYNFDFSLTDEYKMFLNEKNSFTEETLESEIFDWTKRLNNASKAWHEQQQRLVKQNINMRDIEEYTPIDYSPLASVNLKSSTDLESKLIELAKNNYVESIIVKSEEDEAECDSFNDQLKTINAATSVKNNDNYTSSYTRVGILEAGGIIDVSNAAFSNINTIVVKNPNAPISTHANQVADIINGITKLDNLYVSNETSKGLGWFIDNYVRLINCSWGVYDSIHKYRADFDGLYDYQIRNHFLTVVKSAGNAKEGRNTQEQISSPGYAKNIITVGATKTVGTGFLWLTKKEQRADYSCYIPSENKPLLSAPGTVDTPNFGTNSGTSFAAPMVTGSIAAMYVDRLRNDPYIVNTLLTMTANHTKVVDYNYDVGYFDDEIGAGIMDLEKAKTYNKSAYLSYTIWMADTYKQNAGAKTLSLKKNQTIKFSTHWFSFNQQQNATPLTTDYDIRIYQQGTGNLVASSTMSNTNTEMVIYKIPKDDIYSFEVFQYGHKVVPDGSQPISWGYSIV